MDLKIRELAERSRLRRGQKDGTKQDIQEEYLTKWQEEWESSTVGRRTFNLFQNITDRQKLKYLLPDYWTVQLLTGHGAFKDYLHSRGEMVGLRGAEDPFCEKCGDVDTPEHALLRCPVRTGRTQRPTS